MLLPIVVWRTGRSLVYKDPDDLRCIRPTVRFTPLRNQPWCFPPRCWLHRGPVLKLPAVGGFGLHRNTVSITWTHAVPHPGGSISAFSNCTLHSQSVHHRIRTSGYMFLRPKIKKALRGRKSSDLGPFVLKTYRLYQL